MSALEMATIVGCTTNLVHVVKSHEKAWREGRPTRRITGPQPTRTNATAAGTSGSLDDVLAAVRELERERDRLRQTVEQVRALVEMQR
jgi:hypothetical protein